MEEFSIRERIAGAEMILVGLGEELDDSLLQESAEYTFGVQKLRETGANHLLPAWNEFCAKRQGIRRVGEELEKLCGLLADRNYFVVSVSTNGDICRVSWKRDRLVMPCGTVLKKQCGRACEGVLEDVSGEDWERLEAWFERLYSGLQRDEMISDALGSCPVCGGHMVLNNVYADSYNESGYLEQWQLYRKWLAGTVNRNLLVLELGVGMRFPSVIRWPFEKAAYFNQKAFFCRVNKNLYQLAEELSGKGVGISQNAIDWLSAM